MICTDGIVKMFNVFYGCVCLRIGSKMKMNVTETIFFYLSNAYRSGCALTNIFLSFTNFILVL